MTITISKPRWNYVISYTPYSTSLLKKQKELEVLDILRIEVCWMSAYKVECSLKVL